MPEAIRFAPPNARVERRRILNDTCDPQSETAGDRARRLFRCLKPGLSSRLTAKNARTWTVFYRKHSTNAV
jgi:hypothetical protein